MTRRGPVVARGLISLIATAALLVGVPIGLAVLVGWPLPTSVPGGETLSLAMNTGITDEFIVNALAVIAWLAWAQLTLAFLVEAIGAVRGRQPRDLPLAPGLQAAAARSWLVSPNSSQSWRVTPHRSAMRSAPSNCDVYSWCFQ